MLLYLEHSVLTVHNKEQSWLRITQKRKGSKMLKQYFTDGLVQIAIVLSLLRTDLNSYLNSNYVNYPEIQEIIQGQTVAYTQTNFHLSQHTHLGSSELYRKNIELDPSTIYRELRTFHPYVPHINRISVPTFLLLEGTSSNIFSQDTSTSNEDETEDVNNNIDNDDSSSLSLEELQAEGQNLLNTLEESLGAIAPLVQIHQGSDPTNEV